MLQPIVAVGEKLVQHWVATRRARIRAMEEGGDEMGRVRAAAAHYRETETQHARSRGSLYAAIRAALAAGEKIGEVAAESGFDREHVRRIRDGKQA